MFTVDTNILIYYADGDVNVKRFFTDHSFEIFYIPSITVVEFLAHPLMTVGAELAFSNFISQFTILNLDFIIAERAAELKRKYKLSLADTVIAASAIITGSFLVTRNMKDFRKIPNLRIIEL